MAKTFVITIPIGPNNYDRLALTLASLAAQTVPIRVAICHAGPKSAIAEILTPHKALIAYERHGPDRGQSDAINEGWKAVEGDYYNWLNADDFLAPNALSHVADAFASNPDKDIICGQSIILNEEDIFTGLHPAVKAPDEDLYRSNIISQPSCFIKRDVLQAVNWVREDLEYVMDWDLWVRLKEKGYKYHYIDKILSAVLWDKDTKTGSLNKRRLSEIRHVVARQRKPITTLKTLIGFSLFHISEYTIFSKPYRVLQGVMSDGKLREKTFWGSDTTPLNLFHFNSSVQQKIEIEFFDDPSVTLILNGMSQQLTTKRVQLDIALPANQLLCLNIRGEKFKRSDIKHICFV